LVLQYLPIPLVLLSALLGIGFYLTIPLVLPSSLLWFGSIYPYH
jgi:hypothetical protein